MTVVLPRVADATVHLDHLLGRQLEGIGDRCPETACRQRQLLVAGAQRPGRVVAVGARDLDGANRWAWDVVKIGTLAMVVMGMPFWLFPELILSVFIHEPDAMAAAVIPCQRLRPLLGSSIKWG